MNIERMNAVADAIEREQIASFDMSNWIGPEFPSYPSSEGAQEWMESSVDSPACGTVACVAGFAAIISSKKSGFRFKDLIYSAPVAQEYLGLTNEQADTLFMARGYGIKSVNIRKALVPNALRWMAETGEVDWKKAMKYAECVKKEAGLADE